MFDQFLSNNRCSNKGVCMKKGVNNKKTNNVKLGHIAIVETKHLILRTAENYLDKKMCKNFFLIQRTFCSNIPY